MTARGKRALLCSSPLRVEEEKDLLKIVVTLVANSARVRNRGTMVIIRRCKS